MVIIRRTNLPDGEVLFEPHDYRQYVQEVTRQGWEPPPAPLAVSWCQRDSLPEVSEGEIERQVASFFLLGELTGIDYLIQRS
jgi:hypothetical protein